MIKTNTQILEGVLTANQAKTKEACCDGQAESAGQCDIFEFMAKFAGMTVIHPGGLKMTRKLIKALSINPSSNVIDIACGKGSTSVMLAQKYGCRVTGIDLCPELVAEAQELARKKGVTDKVKFLVGDATNLPFDDDVFDAAVSQAMLVLIDNKIDTIKEAVRVIKPKGRAGWLELSWQKPITDEILDKLKNAICAYCMTNVQTFGGWRQIFNQAGIDNIKTDQYSFMPSNLWNMLLDEGAGNTFKIIKNIMTDKEIRDRMRSIKKFFKQYREYIGCGIYTYHK